MKIQRLRKWTCAIIFFAILPLLHGPAHGQQIEITANQDRPRVVIQDFELIGRSFTDKQFSHLGTTLAHTLELALLPFSRDVEVIPRGEIWRILTSDQFKHIKNRRENLFHQEIIEAVAPDVKVTARFTQILDKIAIEASVQYLGSDNDTLPLKLKPVFADKNSSDVLTAFGELGKSVITGARKLYARYSQVIEVERERKVIIGCFVVDGDRKDPSGQVFGAGIAEQLRSIYDRVPSIVITDVQGETDICSTDVSETELLRRFNADSVLSGEISSTSGNNPSEFTLIVEPRLTLRQAEGSVGNSEFEIPLIDAGDDPFPRLVARIAQRSADFINSIYRSTADSRQSTDAVTAEALQQQVRSSDFSALLKAVKEEEERGDSDRAVSLMTGFLSAKSGHSLDISQRSRLHYEIAEIDMSRGRFESAQDFINSSISELKDIDPQTRDEWLWFGLNSLDALNAYHLKKPEDSIKKFEELVRSATLEKGVKRQSKNELSDTNRRYFRFERGTQGDAIRYASVLGHFFVDFKKMDAVENVLSILKLSSPELFEEVAELYLEEQLNAAIRAARERQYNRAYQLAKKVADIEAQASNVKGIAYAAQIRAMIALLKHRDAALDKSEPDLEKRRAKRDRSALHAIEMTRNYLSVASNSSLRTMFHIGLAELYFGLGDLNALADTVEDLSAETGLKDRQKSKDTRLNASQLLTRYFDLVSKIAGKKGYADEIRSYETDTKDTKISSDIWKFSEMRSYLCDGITGIELGPDQIKHIRYVTDLISPVRQSRDANRCKYQNLKTKK